MKAKIVSALRKFIAQRSGIDARNFISCGNDSAGRAAFRAEYNQILRQGRDARALLREVELRDGITGDDIVSASLSAYSGRLSVKVGGDAVSVDYCAGQAWWIEYRAAACAVLSRALWDYARASGYDTGDAIRKWARQQFGRGIASRWFN